MEGEWYELKQLPAGDLRSESGVQFGERLRLLALHLRDIQHSPTITKLCSMGKKIKERRWLGEEVKCMCDRPTLPRSVVVTLMEFDAWLVETLLQSILNLCRRSMFHVYMLRLLKSWWEYSTDEKRSTIAQVAIQLTPKVLKKRNGLSKHLLMSSLPGSIHVAKI